MTAAAFTATFSDWKLVKTRGVVQLVFEVQIENADAAYKVMGGMPHAAKERWFAIARLNDEREVMPHSSGTVSISVVANKTQPDPVTDKPPGRARNPDKRLMTRAAILCTDPVFQQFLLEHDMIPDKNEEQAAIAVRLICGVDSRSKIVPHSAAAQKFDALYSRYSAWRTEPDVVPA